jgi:acyl-[acyl carrier protein]--UDP-N-acetylglucosamine O-acyltransferase
LNLKDALNEIKKLPQNEDIKMLIEFIESSKRGVIKRVRIS